VPEKDQVLMPPDDKLPEVFAYTDQTCRAVAEEMATSGLLRLRVADRDLGRFVGTVGAAELLAGRKRAVRRESERRIAFQSPASDDSSGEDETNLVSR